jgi:secondary thiamine-phosphate synthase enzyme
VLWTQTTITLPALPAGFHLVTEHIVSNVTSLAQCEIGLLHLFVQHTSASLAINENADPDVRADLQRHFEELVPRHAPYYRHTLEGDDDMPAHIKSVLTGTELTIPVRAGRLALGTWQGVYLCEHRDRGGSRRVLATLHGQQRAG